jgi:lysophospholipase L1-like esterase
MIEDPFVKIARHLGGHASPHAQRPRFAYAALGDSFTAGSGCPPGERWADRLAAALRRRNPCLAYANLAREGATSAAVAEQVGPALQLEPDLATVICGANDVLESVRPDVDACAERIAAIFDRLLAALPELLLVTATLPERWRFMEMRPRTGRRVRCGLRRLNAAIRSLAAERGMPLLEVAGHPGLDDPANFAADGLHPSSLGHARAALELERLLLGQPGRHGEGEEQ